MLLVNRYEIKNLEIQEFFSEDRCVLLYNVNMSYSILFAFYDLILELELGWVKKLKTSLNQTNFPVRNK